MSDKIVAYYQLSCETPTPNEYWRGYREGAAAMAGVIGMAEAIRVTHRGPLAESPCPQCGARPYHVGMGCHWCGEYR